VPKVTRKGGGGALPWKRGLLAEILSAAVAAAAPYDVPVGLIRSAKDTLFTSGTLGRFCTMMESLPEAKAKP